MKNKTKLIVVALVVGLLALSIAYASFTGVLKIEGKADASGNFEVIFTNGIVSTSDHGTVIINQADNTKMSANIKLSYPGDGCYVTTTVKNNGSVPAQLVGYNIYNKGTTSTFENEDIEILIPDVDTSSALQPGESKTVTFTVKWKKSSQATSASAEFDIELDYEQATEDFNA